jgi:cysteine desulfurase
MAVYLDHNATSPLDPRVREAMLPWLGERHGNPSSLHQFGQAAREAVEAARVQVAELIHGEPVEVVFTASGTEANNTVLFSAGRRAGFRGRIVISALEHPSVREAAYFLAEAGMELVRVPPGPDGVVDPGRFLAAVTADTRLAALMLANNEVGTLQPVAEVAAACRERGVPVLTDAVQAAGKVAVDATTLGVDFLSLGAHKFHGPLGAAALWCRSGLEVDPFLRGGSQERRRRPSTENVAAIVGLGAACALAKSELAERRRHLAGLRDRFEAGLAAIPRCIVHGAAAPRLPHVSHVAFLGVEGEALLIRLDLAGFAVSTGAACASGAVEPSQTLLAMGMDRDEALSSLRISFGLPNTEEDVERFLAALAAEVRQLRRRLPGVAPEVAVP